ncbi:hypothetical protein FNAPI_1577 [Fusarium napiforme]|uniref:Uncharacterized protein n=1 Tax=Fusarium napiforme TaxID=42672 RepID=A0A8H5K2F6_9HYPO|nr:hypothetical protein FNAPI_1577 [Fusarium napiforme]
MPQVSIADLAHAGRDAYARFQLDDDVDTLTQAIGCLKIVNDHTQLPTVLADLGVYLHDRYGLTGSSSDLEEAIIYECESLAQMGPEYSSRARILNNLGQFYNSRFESTLTPSDIQQAIAQIHLAVMDAVKHDDETAPEYFDNLLELIATQTSYHAAENDSTEAFGKIEEVLDVGRYITEPRHYDQIANLYYVKSEITSQLPELLKAISHAKSAVDATKDDTQYRLLDWLDGMQNLSVFVRTGFKADGALDDLAVTIDLLQQAMNNENLPLEAQSLSAAMALDLLEDKYEATRSYQDFDLALHAYGTAINYETEDNAISDVIWKRHTQATGTMSTLFRKRFEYCKDPQDIDTSVILARRILLTENSPKVEDCLSALALALWTDFRFRGGMEKLDEAVDLARSIVHRQPPSGTDYLGYLNNLSGICQTRYDATGNEADLQTCLDSALEGLSAMVPKGNETLQIAMLLSATVRYASHSRDLAQGKSLPVDLSTSLDLTFSQALALRYRRLQALADISDAVETLRHARATASKYFLFPIVLNNLASTLFDFFKLTRDRETLDNSIDSKASADASRALQVQDAGRGVITGLALSARNDISDLEAHAPGIAAEYKNCRDLLSSQTPAASVRSSGIPSHDHGMDRYELNKRLDELEDKIRREVPGFANFQQPLSTDELKGLANKGPLVSTGGLRTKNARNMSLLGILKWLWNVAVHPVLKALGIQKSPADKKLPRVWWTASGLMALMLIHAAGDHTLETAPNILDFVIQSYTTTLRAMEYARETDCKPLRGADCEMAFIASPNNARSNALLTVEESARELHDAVRQRCKTKVVVGPTKPETLGILE